jgi:hypothetical protein
MPEKGASTSDHQHRRLGRYVPVATPRIAQHRSVSEPVTPCGTGDQPVLEAV